jgi:hypothetical protein
MLSDEPDEESRQEPPKKQEQAVVVPKEQQIQVKEAGSIDIQPASVGVTGSRQTQTGNQQGQELALTTTGSSVSALTDASTIEYSFDDQLSAKVFLANARKYTTASLTIAIYQIRLKMESSQWDIANYLDKTELSEEDNTNKDLELEQVRCCRSKITAFQDELSRRGLHVGTVAEEPHQLSR